MEKKPFRIIAAVLDTKNLVMYMPDGTTIVLSQGDPRIQTILEQAIPQITKQGYADVFIEAPENVYKMFEDNSSGVVRFFRVAKEKLKSFFGLHQEFCTPSYPALPTKVEGEESAEQKPSKDEMLQAVVQDIIAQAIPVKDPNFTEEGLHKQGNIAEEDGQTVKELSKLADETVVAVVDNKAIIPGMELIRTQFERASKLGSTVGVENFLKRLGAVIHDRQHSVEDLLRFMERADMPIAEDGSILVYKVLLRKDKVYVDFHTKKVEQFVGAYVCMDKSLVDHNRRNECSNGLHIARRGYISQFSGDVCTLCKLDPEDVIAVPAYDANKMRVCGYHIIAELTQEQHALLNGNKPITEDPDGKILLAKAMAGDHIGRTHRVEITEQKDGGVITTPLGIHPIVDKTEAIKEIIPQEALNNPAENQSAPPVDPREIAKKAEEEAQKASEQPKAPVVVPTLESASEGSSKERMHKLWAIGLDVPGIATKILEIKKKAKKSWQVLGFNEEQVKHIMKHASGLVDDTPETKKVDFS